MNRFERSGFDPGRRALLGALGAAPLACSWTRAARGLRWLPAGEDRAICVIELAGGNDGLNTLIPIEDERWANARPTLASVRGRAHRIGDGFALHPSLRRLASAFESGRAAAVHGVGYEPPDRSHFRSRDIWHVADPGLSRVGADTTGWLGRAADALAAGGAAVPGMSVGSLGVPLALQGRRAVVPAIRSLDDYELLVDPAGDGDDDLARESLAELVREASRDASDDLAAAIAAASRSALLGVERLRDGLARYRPRADYPDSSLGRDLQLLARIVVSGFGTRVFQVVFGGFDTHANQAPVHAGLLDQLDRALGALIDDLVAHDALGRTMVLLHSEFGRRVAENRSQGTDHGAAAPAFLIGSGVRAGLLGEPPDLGRLQDGDLRATCDFRRVYATLLEFLGVDGAAVLGGRFEVV